MIATSSPGTPTATPPGRTPPRRWGPGRVIAVIASALFLMGGTALMLAAGAIATADALVRDDEGYLMSSEADYDSPGYAIRSESAQIDAGAGLVDLPERLLGTIKATAVPRTPDEVFIGVARTADVDGYLSGVASSTVLEPFGGDDHSPRLAFADGGPPPGLPGDEDFWVESADGAGRQTIVWDPEPGDWSLVVMNAEATNPVRADVAVGAEVPVLDKLAVVLLVAGLGVVLLSATGLLLAANPKES